jgi:hypothetical protein
LPGCASSPALTPRPPSACGPRRRMARPARSAGDPLLRRPPDSRQPPDAAADRSRPVRSADIAAGDVSGLHGRRRPNPDRLSGRGRGTGRGGDLPADRGCDRRAHRRRRDPLRSARGCGDRADRDASGRRDRSFPGRRQDRGRGNRRLSGEHRDPDDPADQHHRSGGLDRDRGADGRARSEGVRGADQGPAAPPARGQPGRGAGVLRSPDPHRARCFALRQYGLSVGDVA